MRPAIWLAIIGSAVLFIVAVALDLFVTYLLLGGIQFIWPKITGPWSVVAAIFALTYPMPTLFLLVHQIQKAWQSEPEPKREQK